MTGHYANSRAASSSAPVPSRPTPISLGKNGGRMPAFEKPFDFAISMVIIKRTYVRNSTIGRHLPYSANSTRSRTQFRKSTTFSHAVTREQSQHRLLLAAFEVTEADSSAASSDSWQQGHRQQQQMAQQNRWSLVSSASSESSSSELSLIHI